MSDKITLFWIYNTLILNQSKQVLIKSVMTSRIVKSVLDLSK